MKATFLSRFTPSLMTPEALEALFVQRETLAERIVELIRNSALTLSKHHTLLIGPRGIGKTHLISLIYYRVRAMDDLHDRLLIAWLREEEWGVTSFLDLLLRIFRALQAEHGDTVSIERVESLYNLPPDAAEHAGRRLLKEFTGDRTLLVLVENLDELFKGLDDEGQKRLRAYLQENPFCTILATAQSLFNGVSLQTSPFYGFFRIHHLEELNLDDAMPLLTKIANFEGKHELALFIQTPIGRARIRAVHRLAGGNHRLYVILSQFLTHESLDELVEPFMRTLDNLTPYYQARMSWLSPQQRKIVEFLCDCRHAAPVKEIAQRCFMTHQTASGQLKALRGMGYVHSETIGRESYYELREPLMRLCIEVKKHRGEPIRLLVDFLRLWCSREELQRRLALLQPDAALEREYLLYALQATEEETEDPRAAACLKDLNACIEREDFVHALQVAEELITIRGNAWDWFVHGYSLGILRRYAEALASCGKAIELDPNNALVWYIRGLALGNLARYVEALASFDKAIEFDLNEAFVWYMRGVALDDLGRYDEALASFDKVIELDPNNARAWRGRGWVLVQLERWDEALASFDRDVELNPSDTLAWSNRGAALGNLRRLDEALASCDRAIDLDSSNAPAWYIRGLALSDLGRHEEALASLDKAIELDPNNAQTWRKRGWALFDLGRRDEALMSFDKEVELNPNNTLAWSDRGAALGSLGRLDEALAASERAIELDANNALAWYIRGVALSELGRHEEALSSYDKAIGLNWRSSHVSFNRAEALLALNRWDEGIAALDDALHRFSHADEPNTGDTGAIARNLFTGTRDATMWRTHIKTLIELYDKHQVVSALGQGLVQSIKALKSPMVSNAAAQLWRDVWQELAGGHREFELPLRLLDAAVRHRETHDPRILLELPIEERTLLEPLLEVEEPQRREPAPLSPYPAQQRRRRPRRGSGEKTAPL